MLLFGKNSELKELKDRVDKLESSARTMQLEWLSTYDKFRSILARIAKRQERDASVSASSAGYQEGSDAQSSGPSSLSERQRQINERILSRRRPPREVEQ